MATQPVIAHGNSYTRKPVSRAVAGAKPIENKNEALRPEHISEGLRRKFIAEAKEIRQRNLTVPASQRVEASAVLANRHRGEFTQEFFDDLFIGCLEAQEVRANNYESNIQNLHGLAREAAASVWEAA
jgi:hypothetical protein